MLIFNCINILVGARQNGSIDPNSNAIKFGEGEGAQISLNDSRIIKLNWRFQVSEVVEYWNPSEQDERTAWRLTPSEVRATLALRYEIHKIIHMYSLNRFFFHSFVFSEMTLNQTKLRDSSYKLVLEWNGTVYTDIKLLNINNSVNEKHGFDGF